MQIQYKILKRTFIPQIILSVIIVLIIRGFIYYTHKPIDTFYFVCICVMIISNVFIFYPNVKKIGLLQFDILGVTVNMNNSAIRYNFLDENIKSLNIKLKINKNRLHTKYPNNSAVNALNKLEIFYNDQIIKYNFKADSVDDLKKLKEMLVKINEKAKILLN
ncbi:MAG TPA: hypothetical protein PK252_09535 [Bacteroidales bacterium]|nr:hypothetical protein [Bacteroidales bacterium]